MFPTTFLQIPPFSLAQIDKESSLLPALRDLTTAHKDGCAGYRKMINLAFPDHENAASLEDLPYLPISLFKAISLRSIPDHDVKVSVQSSGTTSAVKSRVDLDRANASLSAKTLSHILGEVIGKKRKPMLLIDAPSSLRGDGGMSARAAAILGLMPFGHEHAFALRDDLSVNEPSIFAFLEKYTGQDILIYGFTFLVWERFLPFCQTHTPDLSRAILLHSGGWKRLSPLAIDHMTFRKSLTTPTSLGHIVNFYGMAEMPGTIMVQNDNGLLYPPAFADVIIRDPLTLAPLPNGQKGLVQVLNLTAQSFPGHSLLTEDLGIVHNVDEGANGWRGKGLEIVGRLPKAAARGCSVALAASL